MPRDGTATREKILDAAEECVLDRGFAGTSVDAILEVADISRMHYVLMQTMQRD